MTLLLLFFRRRAGPSQCAASPDVESLGAKLTAVRDQTLASPGADLHWVPHLQRTSGERLRNEPSDNLPATAKDQEANIRAVQSLTASPPHGGPPKGPIDAEIDRVEWTPNAAQKFYRDFRRVWYRKAGEQAVTRRTPIRLPIRKERRHPHLRYGNMQNRISALWSSPYLEDVAREFTMMYCQTNLIGMGIKCQERSPQKISGFWSSQKILFKPSDYRVLTNFAIW